MYETIGLLAVLAFIYAATSGWLEKTPINGALIYTVFGVIFGTVGVGVLELEVSAEALRLIAEVTLGIVLFSDASNVDFGALRKNLHLPERLLVIGLPLTILFGFGAAVLLLDELSLIGAAILATMLAPTDAALGKAVVSDTRVPAPIRTSLNVESGLNDGICVPVLFAFLATAAASGEGGGLLHFMLEEIGIGLLVGLGLTWLFSQLLRVAGKKDWIEGPWRQWPVVTLALICFTAAQSLGGSGFIAAFCGGLLFGTYVKEDKEELLESAEATGDMFSLITWTVFGAAVVGPSLGNFSIEILVYAIASLTVIRMLPVYLSLLGTDLDMFERLFAGWFGPRGLASIVFGVIVLGEHLPGIEVITMTVICTVLLSVILHGVTANPLVAVMDRRTRTKAGE